MNNSIHVVCPHCAQINRIPASRSANAPRCGRCAKAVFDGHPVNLSDADFKRYLDKNDLPVVVDFWAEWCGPCKMMAPIFTQTAGEYGGRVLFAKLDTDAAPQTSGRFNIRSIPTLILFRGGREIARQSGALDAGRLRQFVDAAL